MARLPILAVIAAAAACGGDDGAPVELACDGVVRSVSGEPALHVPIGSSITWSTNPPATGMHYPIWARWDTHYTSLERGFWVHNAEHGGVILLYNCPQGCPEVVDALLEVARGVAPDGSCQAPVRNRVLVVADPLLPEEVQVAAVGWNATYTASCFDPYIGTFAAQRYGKGPEDICRDGASLGGTFIEAP